MSVLEVKNDDDGSAIITYWRRKSPKRKKKNHKREKKKIYKVREGKKKNCRTAEADRANTHRNNRKENERFRTFINKTRT